MSSVRAECLTEYFTSATVRIKGRFLIVLPLNCNKEDVDVDVMMSIRCVFRVYENYYKL